jgi:hypothetical protein
VAGSGTAIALKLPLISDENPLSVPDVRATRGETSVKLKAMDRSSPSTRLAGITLEVKTTLSPDVSLEALSASEPPIRRLRR